MISAKKLTLIASAMMMLAANPLYAKDSEAAKPAKLSSAEASSLATIAAIDKSEIMLSVVAVNKKSTSGITDFAKMMIDMHGANLTQILEMAHNFNASSLSSAAGEKIKNETGKDMMKLGGLQGDEFNKAFVDAMVTGHEGALKMIDDQLMKTAKSEEVKKFLTDTRAVVVQHLDDAKKLQADLKS